jgi:hypothetical protein
VPKTKIQDLSRENEITGQEIKRVLGGFNPQPEPPAQWNGHKDFAPRLSSFSLLPK